MKVIAVDNYDRESPNYPDQLIKENLSQKEADELAKRLNLELNAYSNYYHIVVDDLRGLFKFYP